MEKRSLFKNIFKISKPNKTGKQLLKLLNDFMPIFYSTKVNESSVVQTCINTIATHASKFEMKHKKYKFDSATNSNMITQINGDINYLLQFRPNPMNSPSQFIYKIVSNLYSQNNSFVFIDKDTDGMIQGFYPISATSYELLEDDNNNIYLRFNFINGQTYELPYNEIIHLRRMYNKKEIFGDSNDSLKIPVETSNTALQGIGNAIKSTAGLRGLIKYTNGMLKAEDMKKYKNDFVNDYLSMENESGIAMLDSKAEFTPIKVEPMTLSKDQLEYLNENIYDYFGINKNIINSKFTDEEWNAFYESVLEPLAIQMEQEFTAKIFNYKAIKSGHRIVFNVERIKYAKTETKISLIKELGTLGIYTVDEARAVLDMSPIGGDEGNKRLQTLNVVNTNIADEYQLGKEDIANE